MWNGNAKSQEQHHRGQLRVFILNVEEVLEDLEETTLAEISVSCVECGEVSESHECVVSEVNNGWFSAV